MTGIARTHGVVTPSHEIFRGTPGYDPLDIMHSNAVPLPPLQLLLSARQEAGRGGCIDITQFVTPAPDVPVHFRGPIWTHEGNLRHGLVDLLAAFSLRATVTYNNPDEYRRSGIYFQRPARGGRRSYQLEAGELLIGWPDVYLEPEQVVEQISDATYDRASDAHRVVATTDELGEVLDRFGSVLSLGDADREKLTHSVLSHVDTAQSFRRMRGLLDLASA